MTENGVADEVRTEDVDELEDEEAILLHFQRYSESRQALPWNERTLRERVSYYLDRIFLGFLCIVVLIFMSEAVYKMWYVTNVKAIYKSVVDIVTYLLTQEEEEELIEL